MKLFRRDGRHRFTHILTRFRATVERVDRRGHDCLFTGFAPVIVRKGPPQRLRCGSAVREVDE